MNGETGNFELTPIFNALALEVDPEHAVWDLNPAAVLDTDEDAELISDILHEEENDKEEENIT